jgi:2'-5' RNA ligase
MRCFLAIEIPEEVKKELVKIQKEFKEDILGKFVEPENMHLTLKFFGEIEDEKVNDIKEQLKTIKFNKFQATLGSCGAFTPSFVKVLWITIESQNIITKLHNQIDEMLSSLKIKKDKGFSSHITIARVKTLKDKQEFLNKIQEIRVKPFSFEINSFVLKKSTLTENGPIYEDILRVELN